MEVKEAKEQLGADLAACSNGQITLLRTKRNSTFAHMPGHSI